MFCLLTGVSLSASIIREYLHSLLFHTPPNSTHTTLCQPEINMTKSGGGGGDLDLSWKKMRLSGPELFLEGHTEIASANLLALGPI